MELTRCCPAGHLVQPLDPAALQSAQLWWQVMQFWPTCKPVMWAHAGVEHRFSVPL